MKKTKATKKQLKISKSKKSKGSKLAMLDSSAAFFFVSLNVKKITTGLNKKQLCFFCFGFFNVHFRKKYLIFVLASLISILLASHLLKSKVMKKTK